MRAISMDQALSILLNTFKHAETMKAHALAAIVARAVPFRNIAGQDEAPRKSL